MSRCTAPKKLAIVVATGLWLTAGSVQARDPAPPSGSDITSYTFDDHLVGGEGVAPPLEVLRAHGRKDRDSLVRVRTDFVHELYKSVEAL